VSQRELKVSLSKFHEVLPAIRSGFLGSRVELVSLSQTYSPQLMAVSELLNLMPRVFPYKTVIAPNNSLLGVAATLKDNCWLTELGRGYQHMELNELIIAARLNALKEIRSLATEQLYNCQHAGVSVLLAVEEQLPKEELLGVIELLHSCGTKQIIPLTNAATSEIFLTLSPRCKQVIDIGSA